MEGKQGEASPPVRRTIQHGRASIEACYKKKHLMFPTKRKRFCVIKALNAKRPEPAHAESSFLYELLAIGFSVFDLMQTSFRNFHDGVFASPLSEA
jgi:hypothetical protein